MTEVHSTVSAAVDKLNDVQALIECIESQLEADGNAVANRALHIVYDRVCEVVDMLETGMPLAPEVLAIKRYVESDGMVKN